MIWKFERERTRQSVRKLRFGENYARVSKRFRPDLNENERFVVNRGETTGFFSPADATF